MSERGDKFKQDAGKRRWDLLPFSAVRSIVDVLTFGAKKYAPDQWKQVPDARDRYFAALMRHIDSWRAGDLVDPESGLPPLAHAGCCLLFLLWFDQQVLAGEPPKEDEPPIYLATRLEDGRVDWNTASYGYRSEGHTLSPGWIWEPFRLTTSGFQRVDLV